MTAKRDPDSYRDELCINDHALRGDYYVVPPNHDTPFFVISPSEPFGILSLEMTSFLLLINKFLNAHDAHPLHVHGHEITPRELQDVHSIYYL